MEPMSAVSVAAAAVQFLDFGAKIIGAGYEIAASVQGATQENIHTEYLVSHTEHLSERLVQSCAQLKSQFGSGIANQDIANIHSLAVRSQALANDLLLLLRSLKKHPNSTFESWAVVRSTILALWKKDKVESLKKRIEEIKSEVSLAILCMISDEQGCLQVLVRDIQLRCVNMQVQHTSIVNQLRSIIRDELAAQNNGLSNIVDNLNKMQREGSIESKNALRDSLLGNHNNNANAISTELWQLLRIDRAYSQREEQRREMKLERVKRKQQREAKTQKAAAWTDEANQHISQSLPTHQSEEKAPKMNTKMETKLDKLKEKNDAKEQEDDDAEGIRDREQRNRLDPVDWMLLFRLVALTHQKPAEAMWNDLNEFLSRTAKESIQLQILESLQMVGLEQRHVEIPKAYPETYGWMLDHDSPFATWLEVHNGIFWIRGKPGAGKSTMMKFLFENPQTRIILQKWSGQQTVVLAHHYFWSIGKEIQRSKRGLLQSLLFQILRQNPECIENVCKKQWNACMKRQTTFENWTNEDLEESFGNALDSSVSGTSDYFCFFIDGLDEYAVSHPAEQYKLLFSVIFKYASHPGVKFCVSSRPDHVFETNLGGDEEQKLSLEQHTKSDMDRFIQGELNQNHLYRALQAKDVRAASFTREIQRRAQGVFLWVHVAICQLLDGLHDGMDISELQDKLNDLPSEMIALYKHIIDRFDSSYKVRSARSLLIADQATEPLPFMIYWFLGQEIRNPDFYLRLPIQQMPKEEITTRRKDIFVDLNKWCRGLLELGRVAREYDWNIWEPFREYTVNFHHRTVKDFLQTGDMKQFLIERAGAEFSASKALACLFVAQSKILVIQPGSSDEMRSFEWFAQKAQYFAGLYEPTGGPHREHIGKQIEEIAQWYRYQRSTRNTDDQLDIPSTAGRHICRSSEHSTRSKRRYLLIKLGLKN